MIITAVITDDLLKLLYGEPELEKESSEEVLKPFLIGCFTGISGLVENNKSESGYAVSAYPQVSTNLYISTNN